MSDIAQELLEKFSDPSHPFNDRLHEIANLIESQAKRVEMLEENTGGYGASKHSELRDLIQSLQTANAELKEENATLRATADLAWLSLRDYTTAQSRMSEQWFEADDATKHQLLKDLHFCEAGGREAMDALKANAAQPTHNPTDSDGSGT